MTLFLTDIMVEYEKNKTDDPCLQSTGLLDTNNIDDGEKNPKSNPNECKQTG
ncbi:hypothetical protein GCM10009000_082870 [Halobacterium noricense]|uniref:Uncharacterized protein n=1 Tax=Haladaptatus pallidirubidus TaxID=1008152 RepID=A0AAV3URG6_9EURY